MGESYKIYKSTTGVEYNFYVEVDGKERFISTNQPGASLMVHDEKLAKAIEGSNAFKNGKIYLEHTVGDIPQDDNPPVDTEMREHPDVKTVGDAQQVLIEEYGVAEEDIPFKKDVLVKAKELGVKFPNYR